MPERSLLRTMVKQSIESGKYPDDWDVIRQSVYERDDYECCNCGRSETELHAHHIVPLSKGGTNKKTNLKTVCRECHMALHDNRPFAPTHDRYVGKGVPDENNDNVGFVR